MIDPNDKNLPAVDIDDQASDHVKFSRRLFLGSSAALVGAGVAGMSASLMSTTAAASTGQTGAVAPGDLDEYYGFWSGGHSGEVRILGLITTVPPAGARPMKVNACWAIAINTLTVIRITRI